MDAVREEINRLLDKRDKKGIATYGHTLNDCPDDKYEWLTMLNEELLDGIQYAVKENLIIKKKLRQALAHNEYQEAIIRKLQK